MHHPGRQTASQEHGRADREGPTQSTALLMDLLDPRGHVTTARTVYHSLRRRGRQGNLREKIARPILGSGVTGESSLNNGQPRLGACSPVAPAGLPCVKTRRLH
eukprot:4701464-Pyramimonas_sp.AAC.1